MARNYLTVTYISWLSSQWSTFQAHSCRTKLLALAHLAQGPLVQLVLPLLGIETQNHLQL